MKRLLFMALALLACFLGTCLVPASVGLGEEFRRLVAQFR